jgi:hypothetical protein
LTKIFLFIGHLSIAAQPDEQPVPGYQGTVASGVVVDELGATEVLQAIAKPEQALSDSVPRQLDAWLSHKDERPVPVVCPCLAAEKISPLCATGLSGKGLAQAIFVNRHDLQRVRWGAVLRIRRNR